MRPHALLKPLCLTLLLAGCKSEVPDDAVLLTRTEHYLTAGGEVARAEALEGVEVLVPTDDGYTRLPVVEDEVGRALLRDVPQGRVLVRRGTTYVLTGEDERHVELGTYRASRPDVGFTEASFAEASLNLTGLQRWSEVAPLEGARAPGELDELYVLSPETDTFLMSSGPLFLDVGATSVEASEGRLFNMNAETLPRLSPGQDSLWLTQLTLRTAHPELRYTAVRKAAHVPAPAFTGTERLALSAALEEVAQQPFALELRGAAFAGIASSVHPEATLKELSFAITPAAYGLEHGWAGYSGALLTTGPRGLPLADVSTRLEYGNPFPQDWGQVATVSARYAIPLGDSGSFTSGYVEVRDAAERLDGEAVLPVLLPPRNATVDGAPAARSGPLASLTPTLAWEPPAAGTPSHYEVSVLQNGYVHVVAARLRVPADVHQLRLPDGILQPGQPYRIRIAAYTTPTWAQRPLDYPFPHLRADTVLDVVMTPGTTSGQP